MKAPQINVVAGDWARRAPDLRAQFLDHAHALIAAGFARLDRGALAAEEEPTITGHLCAAIRSVLREPDGPPWCEHFSCHEETPLNDSERTGKRRDRADLMIEMTIPPRPELFVEAKPLRTGDSHALSEYVGKDGMGCFLDGRYASAYNFGAMLAYVCAGTVDGWIASLEHRLTRERQNLRLDVEGPVWVPVAFAADGATRRSRHARANLGEIELSHSFYLCHKSAPSNA